MIVKQKLFGLAPRLDMKKIVVLGKDLKWPKCKVKTLGLWLSTDSDLTITLNYDEKTEKVKAIKLLEISQAHATRKNHRSKITGCITVGLLTFTIEL